MYQMAQGLQLQEESAGYSLSKPAHCHKRLACVVNTIWMFTAE